MILDAHPRRVPLASGLQDRAARADAVSVPVVVIWADFPQQEALSDGVAFVHGSRLRSWLEHHDPRDRSRDQVHQIRAALATVAQDGIAPLHAEPTSPPSAI